MIIYYAPTILTDNGFSTTAACGSASRSADLPGDDDRRPGHRRPVGRRRLTLVMVPGAAVALFVLGAFFVTGNAGKDSVPFIVACLVVFMFFNAGGLQLMGWLTGSEIYPLAVRGAGTAAQSATLWSTNLLITLTLLTMIDLLGVGQVFWLYGLFKRGRLGVRVAPDAGADRAQPGGHRVAPGRGEVRPGRLRGQPRRLSRPRVATTAP